MGADDEAGLLGRRRVLGLLGAAAGGLLAAPAHADTALDVRILQTASSLEALAVDVYAAVGEGAGATVAAFAGDAQRRHAGYGQAFRARTTALGGRAQDAPNPKFAALVAAADLATPAKVVDVAATLEKVVTDTYLGNLAMLQDQESKALVASVMAVSAQHLALLRTFGALLAGGAPELVVVPFPEADLDRLPSAAGTAATPDALHRVSGPELIAEPASEALA